MVKKEILNIRLLHIQWIVNGQGLFKMKYIKEVNYNYAGDNVTDADVTYRHEDGTLESENITGEENLSQLHKKLYEQQKSVIGE